MGRKMTTRQAEFAARLAMARDGWEPENYSTRYLIPDQRIAIASDVHIPYHDEELVADLLAKCEQYNVEALVFLGDLLDLPNFSHWGNADKSSIFQRELRIVERVVRLAAEVVPVIYWSRGNHEERILRKLDYHIGLDALVSMAHLNDLSDDGRLIVSDNPTLEAYDGAWLLTHPAQYGSTPLSVPSKLATRYQANVVSAHAHHYGLTTDETGQFLVIESGGLFQPDFHQYLNYRPTTHRQWMQGFWFLLEGDPIGFRKSRPGKLDANRLPVVTPISA